MAARNRTLKHVADDLRAAATTARRAVVSAASIPPEYTRDEASSELAQAIVLLSRAASRFESYCGLPDKAWRSK